MTGNIFFLLNRFSFSGKVKFGDYKKIKNKNKQQ